MDRKADQADVAPARVIVSCYDAARSSSDWRAHCLTVISEDELIRSARRSRYTAPRAILAVGALNEKPAKPPPPRYILPCSYLRRRGLKLDRDHPSTLRDQIQAAAVNRGCNRCPRFDIREFKRL